MCTSPNLSQSSAWQELQQQWKTSLPAILSMLLYKIPWLISLRFVGNMGSEALAAAALATTIANVTGLSLSVGFSSAMTTLAGQARGAQQQRSRSDHETYLLAKSHEDESEPPLLTTMIYLYRGMFIQLLLVLPVGCWWIYGIQPLLVTLGQGELLAIMTQDYLRLLAPGLWAYSIQWTLTTWLQAMELADIPVYATTLGLLLHIPLNLLFIHVFHMGFLGVAMATVAFQCIQPIAMCLYLFGTRTGTARIVAHSHGHTSTSIPFWREATHAMELAGVCQYLSLALPGIVIISEWWASEVCIFLSGTLLPYPNIALGGMTIYQSINSFCFMFPVGCSVAGASRLSSSLGAGRPSDAALVAQVSVASATLLSTILGTILWWTPRSTFPSYFSSDPSVVAEATSLMPLLAIYVVADGIQSSLNGIIKGCGRQCIVMPIVVFAYWIVGVPLAYYITFVQHDGTMCDDNYFCGVRGLVTGMTTGTIVHMLLLAIVVVFTTNWNVESNRAQERMKMVQFKTGHQMSCSTIQDVEVDDNSVEMMII